MDKKKQARLVVLLVAALIVVDQVVKILVKTHMQIGEDIPLIGEWCRLHFIENEGFAFGMSMGGATGNFSEPTATYAECFELHGEPYYLMLIFPISYLNDFSARQGHV